jgi:hypothetical protein
MLPDRFIVASPFFFAVELDFGSAAHRNGAAGAVRGVPTIPPS